MSLSNTAIPSSQPAGSGIYIHIPYCRQACHYCNFHFSVYQGNREEFVKSLLKEIELQKDFLPSGEGFGGKKKLDTIYLGGGTPSILPLEELMLIFGKLADYYHFDEQTEITLEANPDDLTPAKLSELAQTPVNRLSIGIQSFHEPDLRYMNRIHSSDEALKVIHQARAAGFGNLTVDLIYGTPTMSDAQWQENIMKVIEMKIPHLSAYGLTVEKQTALEVFIRRGKATPVDEEQSARQFEMLMSLMQQHGYEHYEISNFCLPGHLSRHNTSYWTGKPYLGLGPSAHSYKPGQRWWNIAHTAEYIRSIGEGVIPCQTEVLTPAQQYDEYLMTSLRTMWGCSPEVVAQRWGQEKASELTTQTQQYIDQGMMQQQGHALVLTQKGKLFADRIASDLFWIE